MNLYAFECLIKWAKEIGIETVGDLKKFKQTYCRTNSNQELINKIHGCYIYNIKFKENYYVIQD